MTNILALIHVYSVLYNVDPRLIESIIKIESNYDTHAISSRGAVGLMQVMPQYVHKSVKQLQNPEINIREGIKLLLKIKEECRHKEDFTYMVCYAMGAPKGNKVKYPKKFFYYKRLTEAMKYVP